MSKFLGAVCVVLLLASVSQAQVSFGGGAGLAGATSGDTAGAERLNIDLNNAFALYAGTYDVSDFQLNVNNFNTGTGNAGTVTPFLATGSPSSYTALWIGSPFDPTSNGVQTAATYAPGTETFTLSSLGNVYAGFFTGNAGSNVPAFANGVGNTDHDGSPTPPAGVGSPITGISNPNLGRTYAFEVNTAVPSSALAPTLSIVNGNSASVGNDLLQTNFGSVTSTLSGDDGTTSPTGFEPVLRDGIATDTSGYNDGDPRGAKVDNGDTITYTFAPNAFGYQIDQIDIFHGWRDDGRDQILDFDVEYSTVGDPGTFLDLLVGGDSGDFASNYGSTSIVPGGSNSFLATNVDSIRFTFNDIENGFGGISEIDIQGVAVPEPASIAIWSILGLALAGYGYFRCRK